MVSFIIDLVVVHGTNPTPTMIQFGIIYVAEYHTDEYDEVVFAVAGPEEWCKIMDAYNFFCFRISGFEIVRTPEMGLGSYLTYLLYVCCLLTIYLLVLSAIFLCIMYY